MDDFGVGDDHVVTGFLVLEHHGVCSRFVEREPMTDTIRIEGEDDLRVVDKIHR
jgi:hypothetical protein